MRKAAYLHIPFCRRRCFYCDFPISVVGDRARGETSLGIAEYVDWLCAEIVATPQDTAPLATVFFGGGTPSLLSSQQVEKILQCLDQTIGIQPQAEISMEMDPGTFSQSQLQTLVGLGVNRISLGVQTFQDRLLEHCGRSHREADILDAVQILHQLSIKNFSIDLISGLPTQSRQEWHESLTRAIDLAPHHLSCYDLVLEPTTVFGRRDQKGQLPLPPETLTAQLYRDASTQLSAVGYEHYEISNYARPGHQCQHNLTYWHNQAFYGFGMGAASYHQGRRVSRPRTRKDYYDWVTRLQQSPDMLLSEMPQLTRSDRLFESLMVGLRLSSGVSLEHLKAESSELQDTLTQKMHPYIQYGWVELTASPFHLKLLDPEGFLYSNQVLVTIWETLDDVFDHRLI